MTKEFDLSKESVWKQISVTKREKFYPSKKVKEFIRLLKKESVDGVIIFSEKSFDKLAGKDLISSKSQKESKK